MSKAEKAAISKLEDEKSSMLGWVIFISVVAATFAFLYFKG